MDLDWSHPVAACAGAVIALLLLWLRRKRPYQLDVTVRREDCDHDDVR